MNNPYKPWLASIENIIDEVDGERAVKTFKLKFKDKKIQEAFSFKPGQCIMVSLFGIGECMFAISSSPTQKKHVEISVMRHGKVTSALHEAKIGDTIGVRGPYGNSFNVEKWVGKNMVFIGGGIGQAPLRSVIQYIINNRDRYGRIDIIYGARSSNDLCFKEELVALEKKGDINVHLSVDKKEKGWTRFIGFVPDNLLKISPSPENTIAITCGPPIMIKFVIENLLKLGFPADRIFTTLEMRMKCGIGKCGRCNIGNIYVCKEGPIFSYQQLQNMKGEK